MEKFVGKKNTNSTHTDIVTAENSGILLLHYNVNENGI